MDKKQSDDKPKILKVAHLGQHKVTRRNLLRDGAGLLLAGSSLGLAAGAAGCGDSAFDIVVKDGKCMCHVVCTCDSEGGSQEKNEESRYKDGQCSCDTVCTCNTVCSCDSEGGGGGGGGSYYYPN